MAEALSLLEFVELLTDSAPLRDAFAVDPDATLSAYGLHHLSPLDVQDAIVLALDNRTIDWSQTYGAGAHGSGSAADAMAFGSGTAASSNIPAS